MLPQMEQFCPQPDRIHGGIAGGMVDFFPAELFFDDGAFSGGTPVKPDDGGPQQFEIFIQQNKTFPLTGDGKGVWDKGYVSGR